MIILGIAILLCLYFWRFTWPALVPLLTWALLKRTLNAQSDERLKHTLSAQSSGGG